MSSKRKSKLELAQRQYYAHQRLARRPHLGNPGVTYCNMKMYFLLGPAIRLTFFIMACSYIRLKQVRFAVLAWRIAAADINSNVGQPSVGSFCAQPRAPPTRSCRHYSSSPVSVACRSSGLRPSRTPNRRPTSRLLVPGVSSPVDAATGPSASTLAGCTAAALFYLLFFARRIHPRVPPRKRRDHLAGLGCGTLGYATHPESYSDLQLGCVSIHSHRDGDLDSW